MMHELDRSNRLADLAGRIREADQAMQSAARDAAEQALEMGRLLIEAKEACGHGQWLPFLANAGISERKAQRLMQLARSGLKPDTVSDLGIKGALESLATPRRSVEAILSCAEVRLPGPKVRMTFDELCAQGREPIKAAIAVSWLPRIVRQGRIYKEAEEAQPGIVKRTVNELLARNEEPTRIALMRSCIAAVRQARMRS
jgi:hypothetical protein